MFITLWWIATSHVLVPLRRLFLMGRNRSELSILMGLLVNVYRYLIHLRQHLGMLVLTSVWLPLHVHSPHLHLLRYPFYLDSYWLLGHVLSCEILLWDNAVTMALIISLLPLLGLWSLNCMLRRVVGALLSHHLIACIRRGEIIVLGH